MSKLYLYQDSAVIEADFSHMNLCEKLLGLSPEDGDSVPAIYHIKSPTYWDIYRVSCLINPEVIGV